MKIETAEIGDVTDTALWVAAYRAQESERKDALFRDPHASLLIGDLGNKIAIRTQGSRYTAWSVVIRTLIIDRFIMKLVSEKAIDTVLNLGAGMDTRPYRLNLPSDLRWIEVDFQKIIEHKELKLKNEAPRCRLERLAMDLSVENSREAFLNQVSGQSQNVLVITEGVIPYLTNEEAASLAQSLYQKKNFNFWITEYYSPEILAFLRTPKRIEQMKNAPFLFYPQNWFQFFKDFGWNELETQYFGVESEKIGRTPPVPGWLKNDPDKKSSINYFLGYITFSKNKESL